MQTSKIKLKLMLHKTICAFIFVFVFCFAANAQNRADASVFGLMKIGEKFTLPECPQASYGGYKITVEAACWKNIRTSYDYSAQKKKKKKDDAATPAPMGMTDTVFVAFPFSEQPTLSKNSDIVVLVIDGVLEGVGFNTSGVSNQEFVVKKLKEKYGEPTVYNPIKVQNRLGATFEAVEALWKFDNLTVEFKSAEGSLDSGLVNIDSPKGKKHREDKLNEIFKKNRDL